MDFLHNICYIQRTHTFEHRQAIRLTSVQYKKQTSENGVGIKGYPQFRLQNLFMPLIGHFKLSRLGIYYYISPKL